MTNLRFLRAVSRMKGPITARVFFRDWGVDVGMAMLIRIPLLSRKQFESNAEVISKMLKLRVHPEQVAELVYQNESLIRSLQERKLDALRIAKLVSRNPKTIAYLKELNFSDGQIGGIIRGIRGPNPIRLSTHSQKELMVTLDLRENFRQYELFREKIQDPKVLGKFYGVADPDVGWLVRVVGPKGAVALANATAVQKAINWFHLLSVPKARSIVGTLGESGLKKLFDRYDWHFIESNGPLIARFARQNISEKEFFERLERLRNRKK